MRDNHRLWRGMILSLELWFWTTHFPPKGFNCRCQADPQPAGSAALWLGSDDKLDRRLVVPPDDGFGELHLRVGQAEG